MGEAGPSRFAPSDVLMSPADWDAYLRNHGKLNVATMLQHAPCNWQDEQGQRRYATLLVAWLRYEGALPPPLPPPPTPRQAKRAKAKEKKTQQQQQEQQAQLAQLAQGACLMQEMMNELHKKADRLSESYEENTAAVKDMRLSLCPAEVDDENMRGGVGQA